jgi:hypothetical protein
MAGSPPSLWITGAAANPHRLPKVGNPWWRSLSAKLVAKGLREPVSAQAISFPPRSPRLQSPSLVGTERIGKSVVFSVVKQTFSLRRHGVDLNRREHGVIDVQVARPGCTAGAHVGHTAKSQPPPATETHAVLLARRPAVGIPRHA